MAVSDLRWADFDESAFMVNADRNSIPSQYIGEWMGSEDGYETKLWISDADNEIHITGGTLSPKRQELVNTVFWLALGAEWDEADNALCMCDVLPDTPTPSFSDIRDGILHERQFTIHGNSLTMTVKFFKARNRQCDDNPYNIYTVEYHRTNQ